MANAKWVLVNVGLPENIQSLLYSIQECGREVEVVSLKEANDYFQENNDERKCVIVRGSIWTSTEFKNTRPNWVGHWHSRPDFLCNRYYSYWGKYLTQKKYCMMPIAEVLRNWDTLFDMYGRDDYLFIRPNSGEKDFESGVFHRKEKETWKFKVVEIWGSLIDEMCVLSRPVKIQKELRLVIANKKVVTGSTYKIAGHICNEGLEIQHDMDKIVEYAEMVENDDPPPNLPPVHVLDVSVDENGLSIMEVGCFCCCGLYTCDLKKIAPAVSEVAEQCFEEGKNAVTVERE